jgi:hypothetical protein
MSLSRADFEKLAQDYNKIGALRTLAFYYEELKRWKMYQSCNEHDLTIGQGDPSRSVDKTVAQWKKKINDLLDNLYPPG